MSLCSKCTRVLTFANVWQPTGLDTPHFDHSAPSAVGGPEMRAEAGLGMRSGPRLVVKRKDADTSPNTNTNTTSTTPEAASPHVSTSVGGGGGYLRPSPSRASSRPACENSSSQYAQAAAVLGGGGDTNNEPPTAHELMRTRSMESIGHDGVSHAALALGTQEARSHVRGGKELLASHHAAAHSLDRHDAQVRACTCVCACVGGVHTWIYISRWGR